MTYPAIYPDPGRAKAGVLLEMGVRGGPEPAATRMITSYAARWTIDTGAAAPDEFEEFRPVAAVALRPERTLIEKLGIVHHLAETFPESAARIPATGRHVYDIYRLLGDGEVCRRLSEDGLVAASREMPRPEAPPAAGPSRPVRRTASRPARPSATALSSRHSHQRWRKPRPLSGASCQPTRR